MTTYSLDVDGGGDRPVSGPVAIGQGLRAARVAVVVTDHRRAAAARADRAGPEAWEIEVVEGPRPGLRASVPNVDAAYDVLRSWCAGDGWWAEAFSWEASG